MNLMELSALVRVTLREKIRDGIIISIDPQKAGLHEKSGQILLDTETRSILIHYSTLQKFKFYGGFEYVDEEKTFRLGDYTIYMPEIDRVKQAFDLYEHQLKSAA